MSIRNPLIVVATCLCLGLAAAGCDEEGEGCPYEGDPGTSQRVGPYATQTTAFQRYDEADAAGCIMSEGTFPCYDETWTRGYCFNVFFD